MHARRLLALAVVVLGAIASARGATPASDAAGVFPQREFEQNLAIARWMVEYDRRARLTFELVIKKDRSTQLKLSPVWFCLESDGAWWAVYGRMSEGTFVPAAVFEEVQSGRFVERAGVIDPRFQRFAQALQDAQPEVAPITRELSVPFNFYVRPDGGRLQIWALPAYQRNNIVGYGLALLFEYDRHATKRVRTVRFGAALRGVRASDALDFTLTNYEHDAPTVGNIYVVLNHRRRFKSLVIETTHFVSTLMDTETGPAWQHTKW